VQSLEFVKNYNLMNIKKALNIENLKNTDFFNIRRFIIVFTTYSLISIWLANSVANKDKELMHLSQELKILKSEYVATKTILMSESKRSYLLEKAESFDFFSSEKALTTINFYNEH